MEEKKTDSARKIITRISAVAIAANVILIALKITFGLIYDNLSVLSDAIHSGLDIAISFLIIIAVALANPKRDKSHNYGHEKVEPLITLFLSVVITAIAGLLIYEGINGIMHPEAAELNWYLISITILSIAAKEAIFWYEIHYAKKLNSAMLKADAWHSRSDSLSSIAVLIGLISSSFTGNQIIESIAVLVVAGMILKVAFDTVRPAVQQLTDKAASEEVCEKIRGIAAQTEGVKNIDSLKTRIFANNINIDIDIAVDSKLSVDESHIIADAVRECLEQTPDLHIKHCMVHINPFDGTPETKSPAETAPIKTKKQIK